VVLCRPLRRLRLAHDLGTQAEDEKAISLSKISKVVPEQVSPFLSTMRAGMSETTGAAWIVTYGEPQICRARCFGSA
jgi:hypothetical protein